MLTFNAAKRLFIAGLLLMVQAVAYAQTPPDGPLISTSINGLETIDNGQIRVGVDSRYGGAITWLSAAGRGNMVNNYDLGRQIQIALYGLPEDYSRNGSPSWVGLGWNPIQAGDTYNNPSQVIAFEKRANLLYVKTIPKQFALNNQPGEATIEHWVRLAGNVVKVHARVVMNRSDHTPYMARAQEWPCAYLNATYRHVWTYRGDNPYTYGPMSEMIPPMQQENLRPVTEPWMAATDDSGFGMAIFVPKNYQWTKAYFGSDYYDTSEFSATSSYIAATQFEQLDYNMVHEWDYEFVVGNLYSIRSYIYAQPRLAPTINYRFDNSRQGWYYFEAHDSGWPIQGQLNVTLTNRDRDQIKSPVGFWRGSDNKKLYLRAAFRTQHNFFRLHWKQLPDHEFYTLSDRFLDFPIQNDGQMRTYEIDLSQKAGWLNTTITQLNLRPSLEGPAVNGSVRIEWISTTPDGSSAPPSTTVITPPVTSTTTPVTTALQLVAPVYNCATGAITFKTTGGDGTLIEYAALGISDWSTNPNQLVDAAIRQNPRSISLLARQSNQLVVYVFDLGAACSGTPVVTPPTTTPVTPPVVTPLQLVAPVYDCATGAITFKTTGGNGTLIEYAGLGITNWSISPYQQVDAAIRQNPRPISLLARQNGVAVIYVFDLGAACTATPAETVPPPTKAAQPAPPTSTVFQLVAPGYNCATGAFTFKTTGGDGTLVEFMAVGITPWSGNPNQRVEMELRQDPKPITLFARQSGQVVFLIFDLLTTCGGSGRAAAGKTGTEAPWQMRVLGNPVSEVLTVEVNGIDSQALTIDLLTATGQLIERRFIQQPKNDDRYLFEVGREAPGLLLVRASSATRQQVVKVLKH